MTWSDTLCLLLVAEIPQDQASIEYTLRAITERIGVLDPAGDEYAAAHRKIDALLAARDRLEQAGRQ